jgi:hypothetical protein
MGITTVIDHGRQMDLDRQAKDKGDNGSDTSDEDHENWNTSQSNLASQNQMARPQAPGAWNITVQRSIVQTRATDVQAP